MKVNIILGPPGTGKTTKLLTLVEESIKSGIKPDEIGFLAFTKKAATEAKTRAIEKFGLNERQLLYFRTIHSLAFRQLGLSKVQVMQKNHYRELGSLLSIDMSGSANMDEGTMAYGMSEGDRLIFIDGLARSKMITVREQWEQMNEDVDWWELDRVSRGLVKYKEANGLLDFTDMIELFIKQGYTPKLKVLFIDEAQDLSKLQWLAVNRLIELAEVTYVSGDDDQSIFAWSGADTNHFINMPGTVTVLDHSYRVPKVIQKLALGITDQIQNRRKKVWQSRASEGSIIWHADLDTVPLDQGEWLLLARNGYMLKQFEDHCLLNGFSFDSTHWSPLHSPSLTAIRYWEQLRKGEDLTQEQTKKVMNYIHIDQRPKTNVLSTYATFNMPLLKTLGLKTEDIWHRALGRITADEREYFIAARRRGETLVGKPRIRISTIHGSKGGEAQNVLLLTDLAPRTYNEMANNFDDESRVWYVGTTRAKESLHLMQPNTNMSFNL